jgi:hypothetical protein
MGAMCFSRNVRAGRRNHPASRRRHHGVMSNGDQIKHSSNRGLGAVFSGVVAIATLGALVFAYMVDVGADVLLAVLAAVTPGGAL